MLRRRRLVLTVAVAVAGAVLIGCAPAAAPTRTPTPQFTSEAQAFKAAEATYRAYVDATNAVVLSDPKTFEPVYKWTSGDNYDAEKKSLTEMYSKGWVVSGSSVVVSFSGTSFTPNANPIVTAVACTDVRDVKVVNATGESQVSPDRPNRYARKLGFAKSLLTPTGLTVSTTTAIEDQSCFK